MKNHLLPIAFAVTLLLVGGCATTGPLTEAKAPGPRTVGSIRYQVQGEGSPALVLIHGNFDRLETWDRVVPELAAHFRVVTLDLPGFGLSPNPFQAWDLDSLAAGVALVMADAGVERAVLVGNSLGGAVAATFAARWPDLVEGVVLEDANFVTAWPSSKMGSAILGIMVAGNKLKLAPKSKEKQEQLKAAVAAGLEVALPGLGVPTPEAVVEHYTRGFEGTAFDAVKNTNSAFSLSGLPRRFLDGRTRHPFPVLIPWGLQDQLIPLTAAEEIRRTIPGSGLVLFESCGHAPHLERPEEFARMLISTFSGPGAPVIRDRYIPVEGVSPRIDPVLNVLPRVEQILRSHETSRGAGLPLALFLALNQVSLGEMEEAWTTMTGIPEDAAPYIPGFRAWLKGLRLEVAHSEGAEDAYILALQSLSGWDRAYPLMRLVRFPLTQEHRALVDQALASPKDPTESESILMVLARADWFLANDRFEEALVQLERLPEDRGDQVFLLQRKVLANLGLGRLAEARDALTMAIREVRFWRDLGLDQTLAADQVAACNTVLSTWLDAEEGIQGYAACEGWDLSWDHAATILARLPPPVLPASWVARCEVTHSLGYPGRDKNEPKVQTLKAMLQPDAGVLASLGLARLLVATQQYRDAIAVLDQVPEQVAQRIPEVLRMKLALRALMKDRKAVAEARQLAKTHPDDPAWQGVLATTLHAAGHPEEAAEILGRMLLLDSSPLLQQELALVQLDLNQPDLARKALKNLEEKYFRWLNSPLRFYPHLDRLARPHL